MRGLRVIMDKYYEKVKELLLAKGEMGVNAIAIELRVPVSTMQKYLERQDYFKKTDRRKWDLPERATNNAVKQQSSNHLDTVALTIANQSQMVRAQLEAALMSLSIIETQSSIVTNAATMARLSVAGNSKQIDYRLSKFAENVSTMKTAIKQNANKVSDKYKELLTRLDLLELSLRMGSIFVNETLVPELSALLLNEIEELKEETVSLLEKYQIGQTEQNSSGTNQDETDTE